MRTARVCVCVCALHGVLSEVRCTVVSSTWVRCEVYSQRRLHVARCLFASAVVCFGLLLVAFCGCTARILEHLRPLSEATAVLDDDWRVRVHITANGPQWIHECA